MAALTDFAAVVRNLGHNPLLAHGSSGNASLKHDGVLWITPSGSWLRDSGENDDAFVPVRIDEALRRFSSGAHTIATDSHGDRKPSIETWAHLVIPHRFVIHLHAVNTVACSVLEDGPARASQLLQGLDWDWISYTPSGRALGRRIFCLSTSMPQVLLLANHGLIVAADSLAEAASLVAEVECRLRMEPRPMIPPLLRLLAERTDEPRYSPATDRVTHSLATDPVSLERILDGALYPCHWAYVARLTALCSAHETAWETASGFQALHGYLPSAILVPGEGVLVRKDADPEVLEQLRGLAEVARRLPDGVPVRYLSPPEMAGLAADFGIASPPPALSRCTELSL